ncbi:MAG: hypothetical protein H8M99_04890 [Gloeobacteraceae cyanobacterium ES-bin-144]|nr:hypothetical protein [Verrucomicrobiales bacterium]
MTLDLGASYPLEKILLIPAQKDFLEDAGIFPKRFTLELSNYSDFSRRLIIFTSGSDHFPKPDNTPVSFTTKETARYVRLTVQEESNKGAIDLFGLSEFVVISKGEPVSFNASVTTVGELDSTGIWYPKALVDGRTPLGIWHNGLRTNNDPGDAVTINAPEETTTWSITLDATTVIDRVVLFPYEISNSFAASILPEALEINLISKDEAVGETVSEWRNPLPGASNMTPIVIPLHGRGAKEIRVIAKQPWVMGDRKIHALSEIEIWAGGKNIALGKTAIRSLGTESTKISSLTDGYSSTKKITQVGTWFSQIHDRNRLENELQTLTLAHKQLAASSELNTTWGSAIILGLTFLVPVFIVERRRLMSRAQLDQIRKRIASDLHDDIGSNLGSISLIARSARKDLAQVNGNKELAQDLSEVETIARESSLAMRDIVWLLERNQDSIGDLIQRMRETAGRLLREIDFNLDCESHKTTSKLSLDAKRHLFLFYKEAIHNVIKHSQATKVSIRIWDESDKLGLEITDNGVGIPMVGENTPISINKLEDRARVLEGLLHIHSNKESGTQIRLLVKRSHLTHHPAVS